MDNRQKGFTLAELLIVVAIIAVLVAISIPLFSNKLEKSRESTDAANIRGQYAQVIAEVIETGANTNINGATYGKIKLEQATADWQNDELKNNINGKAGSIYGEYPKPGGYAWIAYVDRVVELHYEDGTGGSESGGTETGGTGGTMIAANTQQNSGVTFTIHGNAGDKTLKFNSPFSEKVVVTFYAHKGGGEGSATSCEPTIEISPGEGSVNLTDLKNNGWLGISFSTPVPQDLYDEFIASFKLD